MVKANLDIMDGIHSSVYEFESGYIYRNQGSENTLLFLLLIAPFI